MRYARKLLGLAALAAGVALSAGIATAGGSRNAPVRTMAFETPEFSMVDAPLGRASGRAAAVPWTSGSSIVSAGEGVIAVDPDAGMLVLADREGNRLAQLRVGIGAAQLVYHAPSHTAYLADRRSDRIVVIEVGRALRVKTTIKTPADPYGIALTPSGKTVAVTAVADQVLVGYDTGTMKERWRTRIGPEPRGVAFSPTADEAIVTMLSSNAVAKVAFEARKPPSVSYASITPRDATPAGGRGQAFVRNAFTATYVGPGMAVVPHQLSRPVSSEDRVDTGTYGGGGQLPPVEHRLAFLEGGRGGIAVASARAQLHQPRAVAYDRAADRLYVAGLGSDEVLALADASKGSIKGEWQRRLSDGGERCGPTGLAVGRRGELFAYCSFSHRVVRLDANAHEVAGRTSSPGFAMGPVLARTQLSAGAERGRVLFHLGEDSKVSGGGFLACATCHAEGRADGLSWQIEGKTLQTPLLAGRIRGTHPYKWDGQDPNITASLTNTVRRLGGRGLTPAEASDLQAYLDTLPRPRPPSVRDASAVERGKTLFFGMSGCGSCHSGPRLTDRKRYNLAKDMPKVDTPSLIGLAASAPYYHDGSAQTLEAALMENGTIHDMGVTVGLTDAQIGDLVAYLKTL